MSFKKFLTSRAFFISLALAIIIVALLLTLTMKMLKNYTHHGISYAVPELTGMTLDEASSAAEATLLKVEVLDSVYNKNAVPGTVVDQVPESMKKVKEGRVIFLTMNSMEPEKIKLPKLTDISFRQAQVLLEACGLTINSISYEPSEFNDLVLMVRQNSTIVQEGDMLIRGSAVDLVIGQSKGNLETQLPDLFGLFMEEAKDKLTDTRLNMGVIIYDRTITTKDDTLNARIWRQMPEPKTTSKVYLGTSIDLWLTVDQDKLIREISEN